MLKAGHPHIHRSRYPVNLSTPKLLLSGANATPLERAEAVPDIIGGLGCNKDLEWGVRRRKASLWRRESWHCSTDLSLSVLDHTLIRHLCNERSDAVPLLSLWKTTTRSRQTLLATNPGWPFNSLVSDQRKEMYSKHDQKCVICVMCAILPQSCIVVEKAKTLI